MNATLNAFRKAMIPVTVLLATCVAQAVNVDVPGISNPYLAGMPDDTTTYGDLKDDKAPYQSPLLVPLVLPAGGWIEVSNATGLVANRDEEVAGIYFEAGPDGDASHINAHYDGASNAVAEHGKSNMWGPICALVGVFLDDSQPVGSPGELDFGNSATAISRNYLDLSPGLQQVFFIGDGQTSGAVQQKIHIPAGATRLYLAVWDAYEWNNNTGGFNVDVNAFIPEPATLVLLAIGGSAILLRYRRTARR